METVATKLGDMVRLACCDPTSHTEACLNYLSYEIDGELAIITIDYPPVNALSADVRTGLGSALERAAEDAGVEAVIIACAGKTFIAGADITQFGTSSAQQKPLLSDLQRTIERFAKPVIAAIHGTALGGGLELALACSARIAAASAKVGLPEVNLGLLPGAGGTQRLPRLIGPAPAIEIMISGRHVPADEALRLGIVDVVADDARAAAITFARTALRENRRFACTIDRTDKVGDADPALFDAAREQAATKYRGRIAPLAIIECVRAACEKPAAEGLAFEKAEFARLFQSDQRKALMHYFSAEREARRIPGLTADVAAMPVEKVAVVGSGTMGGGIAMVFANAGIPVRLVDISSEALARGLGTIEKNYARSVDRGSLPRERAEQALALIGTTTRYEDLGDVDLVIEAVFEKMELKQEIFARLDAVTQPHAILASNTSSLDIDAIAAATNRPDKVLGMHFFAPANVMKLLENVRGKASSPQTLRTAMELGGRIGKVVALAGNCDGFIGNRMLQYYSAMSEFLMEQGATPEQIDRVAVDFGMPMGSPSMRDLTGMDTALLVRKAREAKLPPGERFSPILERMVAAGRIGQKAGRGFYRYEGREKFADPEVLDIIAGVARDLGIRQRSFTDEEVRDRLFMPLVNEGAKELEDGTALRASDIDVVWCNGYNFPTWRGGPMFWGQEAGLHRVRDIALQLGDELGPRWAPGPLLVDLAASGRTWKDAGY